jgi:hypothetical protein
VTSGGGIVKPAGAPLWQAASKTLAAVKSPKVASLDDIFIADQIKIYFFF